MYTIGSAEAKALPVIQPSSGPPAPPSAFQKHFPITLSRWNAGDPSSQKDRQANENGAEVSLVLTPDDISHQRLRDAETCEVSFDPDEAERIAFREDALSDKDARESVEKAVQKIYESDHRLHRSNFLAITPSHLPLICDCRCHSRPVPMRRISEDGVSRDIFGDKRVARVSDGTTHAVDAFLSNKRGAER
jgi:hypothetical protein